MQYALDFGDCVVISEFTDETPYPVYIETESEEATAANEAIVKYIRGS